RALYLATINNMPHNIELEMSNLIKTFLWNDKQRGLIDKCYTYAPTNKGGLNMPNIKARLEAIRIVWLKKYLTNEKRPAWAYVADNILRNNITPKPKTEPKSCISWALQSWHESAKKETKIPKQIKEMLQTARKYNLGLDSCQLSIPTLKKLPIWHHLAAENNYLWNKKSSKCLRDNHGVRTVNHLLTVPIAPACNNPQTCQKMADILLNRLPMKFNPLTQPPIHPLDHTPQRQKKNKEINYEKHEITFDPDLTEKDSPNKNI
ncbi:hypothetical protein EDD17DRAFT_1473331, partial [Pisolithus thermaeus]